MADAFEHQLQRGTAPARQGGVKLDGEPIGADTLDLDPAELDGASCRSASAASPASAPARLGPGDSPRRYTPSSLWAGPA